MCLEPANGYCENSEAVSCIKQARVNPIGAENLLVGMAFPFLYNFLNSENISRQQWENSLLLSGPPSLPVRLFVNPLTSA